jgi:hypothetical protein
MPTACAVGISLKSLQGLVVGSSPAAAVGSAEAQFDVGGCDRDGEQDAHLDEAAHPNIGGEVDAVASLEVGVVPLHARARVVLRLPVGAVVGRHLPSDRFVLGVPDGGVDGASRCCPTFGHQERGKFLGISASRSAIGGAPARRTLWQPSRVRRLIPWVLLSVLGAVTIAAGFLGHFSAPSTGTSDHRSLFSPYYLTGLPLSLARQVAKDAGIHLSVIRVPSKSPIGLVIGEDPNVQ